MNPTALVPAANGPTLPEPVARRGINEAQWRTLCQSLYPGADPKSVLLVIDYCAARKLDPLKKPAHIVPMEVKDARTGKYEWRDVVMPGIYELRTTAQRTGVYLGHSKPEYGPEEECRGVKAPAWCEFTVYRWNEKAGRQVDYPIRVYFREVVATNRDGKANARWSRAPIQMLEKCLEAKGLREAFPDELGGEQTMEEMDGQRAIDMSATVVDDKPALPRPDGYENWVADLTCAADEGPEKLAAAWKASPQPCREYLTKSEPDALDLLQQRAAAKTAPPPPAAGAADAPF